MRERSDFGTSLFTSSGSRKYLNAVERRRFVRTTKRAATIIRLFCLTLYWTGARVSEVLALTPLAIDIDSGVISIYTLKRRKPMVRQVPVPRELLVALNGFFRLRQRLRDPKLATKRLWKWHRATAWRYCKVMMLASGVVGSAAMPKGLRHGFGVHAFRCRMPPHLVQRWLGHASLRTTAIYADVAGPDERAIASRMWRGQETMRLSSHT